MGDNESIATEEELKIFVEKIKLKSNGVYHIEDVNVNVNVNDKLLEGIGSSSDRRLRKWRRIRRELVKKPGSNLNGSKIGDISNILVNVNGDSEKSEEDLGSRSSTAASVARIKHDEDLQKNGRIEPVKKARGVVIEKEKLSSTMGFDSRSVNFVFVQGTNTVASKGRQSGTFGKCDEVCSDAAYYGDKDLNEEVRVEFVKIYGESDDDDVLQEDVADENDWEVKDEKIGKHDLLVESIKGLCFAHEEVEREMQKWKDIKKNDPSTCDHPMHELLELQDAKILELEFVLTSKDTKTEFEDTLKKIIQAEVEYVAIKTTTESLTAKMKHNLHQNNISPQKLETTEDVKKQQNEMCLSSTNTQVLKKQAEKLETIEDIKKLQKRVSRFTSFFMIQLILLLVILYPKFSTQDVKIVPT